jgi:chemotaxis protein histidine kinase CheA/ActR/RegA family two-component response regulator
MSELEADGLDGFRVRLEAIRGRIERTNPEQPGDLKPLRAEIETAQAEAHALGLPEVAAALRQLGLVAEVWECLALERSQSARDVAEFSLRAFDSLAHAAVGGAFSDDPSWIIRDSSELWRDYLQLIDPWAAGAPESAGATTSGEEAPAPDDSPALDPNTLIKLLTGGPARAASPAPKAAPARDTREPACPDPQPVRPPDPLPQPAPAGATPAPAAAPPAPATTRPAPPAARPAPEPPEPAGAPGWVISPLMTTGDEPSAGGRPADRAVPNVSPADHGAAEVLPPGLELDPEFREAFLAEGTDLFERIEALVLKLGREPDASPTLHELGRCFHTLKGAAGSVGLAEFSARVHSLEDRLESCAGNPPAELVDLLLKTVGDFEQLLQALRRGDAPRAPAPPPPPPWPSRQGSAAVPPPRTAPAARKDEPTPESATNEGLLRIPSGRLDELMDLVSELIARRGVLSEQAETVKALAATARTCRNRLLASIERLRDVGVDPRVDLPGLIRALTEQGEDLAVLIQSAQASAVPLTDDGDAIARISLQLWESLQAIQIVPVRGLFHRLSRVARDAARIEGREVEVVMVGEDTGLDRAVQDKAFEPLLHIVRNAVGHGIEAAAERARSGKSSVGRVTLEARREGNRAVLVVQDDGRGLDYPAIEAKGRRLGLIAPDETPGIDRLNALIFQSGFSTRPEANAISGRGVGMDVVAKEVGRLRGTIDLASQSGQGTSITIRLPTRLALERAMVVRVDGQAFALPVELIELAQPFEPKEGQEWGPNATMRVREERVPLVDARRALGISMNAPDPCPKLILVRADGGPLALLVDEIVGARELVVKPLGPLLAGHPVISGTSVSLTGEVILSLNPSDLARWHREGSAVPAGGAAPTPAARTAPVLVVDDSISVRRVAARHLSALGFEVDEVSDGVEAIQKLRSRPYRLVLTDLEMPRMDGFELLAQLERMGSLSATPVVVTSTRSDPETRRRVLALGAAAFVAKPLEPGELAAVVGRVGARGEPVPA